MWVSSPNIRHAHPPKKKKDVSHGKVQSYSLPHNSGQSCDIIFFLSKKKGGGGRPGAKLCACAQAAKVVILFFFPAKKKKDVVDGKVQSCAIPPSGNICDILKQASVIVQDPNVAACRLANPDDAP